MKTFIRTGFFAGSLIMSAAAFAQQGMPSGNMPMPHGNMPGMDHSAHMGGPAPAANANSPSSAAFGAANAKMHEGMSVPMTGDTDVDFAQGMIPHHQGAIDMAKIELAFGKDPELRKLAEDIIKAQESEIAFLKSWLEKNAKK